MKKLLVSCCALLCSAGLFAQDVVLSQYFAAPMMLNPATTGLIAQDIRVGGGYRSQWRNISPNPNNTVMCSADAPILRRHLPKGDAIGIGIQGLYDNFGSGGTVLKSVGLSLSYHRALGKDSTQHISVGAQVMGINKRLEFVQVFPPYSTITTRIIYADYAAGIMYTRAIGYRGAFYAGYGLYHITQPVEVYSYFSRTIIPIRHMAHAGAKLGLNKRTDIYVNCSYQQQYGKDLALGSYVGFWLNPGSAKKLKQSTLYLGGWYRYQDAVAPYIGVEWAQVRLGLSYDVNISSFTPASRSNGAYELSFIYSARVKKRAINSWYCPKLY